MSDIVITHLTPDTPIEPLRGGFSGAVNNLLATSFIDSKNKSEVNMAALSIMATHAIFILILLCIQIPQAQAVNYVYDDLNRLTEVHYDDSTWLKYDYDEVGNRTERTYYGYLSISVASGPHGSISPSSANVLYGNSQSFDIIPATGYHITDVSVNNVSQGPISSYTFSDVTANQAISATFGINTYSITTSIDGDGGTISPSSATPTYGSSQTFTITPDADFSIADVKVDGGSVGTVATYQIPNISSNHTISASFTMSCPTPPVKNVRTNITYANLQSAYDDVTNTLNGDTLLVHAIQLVENFTANRDISLTIDGGYKCDLSTNPYKTKIKGAPRISAGSVKMKNIRVSY